ncbi:MAG: recombination protein NinB [Nitrosomonas sp.]|nr:recombination protein NinB [Nitrosomonas sp.]
MYAYFELSHQIARNGAAQACLNAPDGYVVMIKEKTRTLAQNAKMWPMLDDISTQVEWYKNWLTEEEWKDFFSAIILKQKVVPNMEGSGFIAVGGSTSKMGKKMFSDLIELMYAFGAEHNVKWSEKSKVIFEQYRNAA